MFDLSYVQDPDKYDKYVSDNADLLELDESFKESYLEIIQRFYTLFEGIYNYYTNLQGYLMDIKDGKYIEFTWDAILQDKDGKRNMVECVYHYGAMLLLLDRLIPSLARERIVTCYLRYMGSSASPLLLASALPAILCTARCHSCLSTMLRVQLHLLLPSLALLVLL